MRLRGSGGGTHGLAARPSTVISKCTALVTGSFGFRQRFMLKLTPDRQLICMRRLQQFGCSASRGQRVWGHRKAARSGFCSALNSAFFVGRKCYAWTLPVPYALSILAVTVEATTRDENEEQTLSVS